MRESPALTVDAVILVKGRILLVRRRNPPFQGSYALPGGFVERGETVEAAVVRETEEETGLRTGVRRLLGVYSEPDRDPRGHTVTVAFELEVLGGEMRAGDDASGLKLFGLNDLPELAFDHGRIISDFVRRK